MFPRRTVQHLLFALAIVLLVGSLGAWPISAEQGQVAVAYRIDRSAIPKWVTQRDLTLVVPVSEQVETVEAWGDGHPLPVSLQDGLARVTSGAEIVAFRATGGQIASGDLGSASIATLRDDKLWAYSLTFDDGQYSVYAYAYPELSRFGYDAGIAVIGRWVDLEHDPVASGYCDSDELLEMLAAGWGMFNHSYSHFSSEADITFADARAAQEAIVASLGMSPSVFTSPHVSPLWGQVIDENQDALGLYLVQAYSDSGDRLMTVDGPLVLGERAVHMGRDDIKHWVEGDYSYFEQAHGSALSHSGSHAWVSLHAHKVTYDEDWSAVAASTAHLYNTYGPGGSDEVWVAPADAVFQYWVTRSLAVLQETDLPSLLEGSAPQTDSVMVLQYELGGNLQVSDAYVQEAYPAATHPGAHGLKVGVGPGMRSAALLRFELPDLPEGAVVERALLSVYGAAHSNPAGVDLQVAPLLTPWVAADVCWREASEGVAWQASGALGEEDAGATAGSAHVQGGAEAERWYSLDVSQVVRDWQSGVADNFGLIVRISGGVYKTTTLVGSMHPDTERRPKLVIEYGFPIQGFDLQEPTPTVDPTPVGRRLLLPLLLSS